MRALLALMCVAGVASAGGRKGKPDAYTKAAREAFDKAVKAEDAGDLREARAQYERAFEISPHPSTAYNLANVLDRAGLWDLALENYELYLALAPVASDRADIEKLISKRLGQKATVRIEDKNSTLQLDTAYILVDGVIVVRPGEAKVDSSQSVPAAEIQILPGEHDIDVVTPVTFASKRVDIELRNRDIVELDAPASVVGNVVIATTSQQSAHTDTSRGNTRSSRSSPPAGRLVVSLEEDGAYCVPLAINVPAKIKDVLFVYVASTEPRLWGYPPRRCRAYTVKQQTLVFPP